MTQKELKIKGPVRTRIAPSPTGNPHIGNFYTALLNYVLAKKYGGQFVIRIEDTDRTRFVEGAEDQFFEAVDWLQINEDESPRKSGPFAPYRQSERLPLYRSHAEELVQKGAAYYCFCSEERLSQLRKDHQEKGLPPKYDRHCLSLSKDEISQKIKSGEPNVIRLKVPDTGIMGFDDLLRGRIEFENRLLDDQVLLKSDGFPTYHLGVVVDDYAMKIDYVLRAEEWISSTPKHLLLYESFGWPPPVYVHLPLLRNPDKSKLSKRKNPTSVLWYRDEGFLPEALRNYLTNLGWTHPTEKEIYSFEEFLDKFNIADIKPSAPIFDIQKLTWMNGVYIREMSVEELSKRLVNYLPNLQEVDYEYLLKIIPLIQERLKKLNEFTDLTDFFFSEPEIDPRLIIQKGRTVKETSEALAEILKFFSNIKTWSASQLEECAREWLDKSNWTTKDFFMPLRVAMTGKTATPPLFETMEVLGKEVCQKRLERALEAVSSVKK